MNDFNLPCSVHLMPKYSSLEILKVIEQLYQIFPHNYHMESYLHVRFVAYVQYLSK